LFISDIITLLLFLVNPAQNPFIQLQQNNQIWLLLMLRIELKQSCYTNWREIDE
jgi:hypothetical protein